MGRDKGIHFAAGAVIARTSYPAFKGLLKNEVAAQVCAFGATLLVSLAKKVSDGRRVGGEDLAARTFGGGRMFLVRIEWKERAQERNAEGQE